MSAGGGKVTFTLGGHRLLGGGDGVMGPGELGAGGPPRAAGGGFSVPRQPGTAADSELPRRNPW